MSRFTPSDLRRRSTVGERIMWMHLRARQMVGLKFRRQHPLGRYVGDFVCLSRKVVVEVDGAVHRNQRTYDEHRDEWLARQGFLVVRIADEDLLKDIDGTVDRLRRELIRRLDL